jgi:RNA polymerase sigma factor (sigma-70 family)
MAVLYERYRETGLKFIQGLMSHGQEAEDLFQEGFMKAVAAIRNGYGPTDAFRPYLIICLRVVVATFWTKRARVWPLTEEDMDPVPGEDPALEAALSLFEHERVVAAMRSVPVRWRTVLWHADVLGQKPSDIAPVMGIAPNAVSALLIRARAGLRAAYEKEDTHGPGSSAPGA